MDIEREIYGGGDELRIFGERPSDPGAEESVNINELIVKCKKSKEALCTLYNIFKKDVFNVAFGITGDYHLSEDCVVETFIRLSQWKKFSPEKGNGKGFILTLARNVALEERRKYKKECVSQVIQSYGDADETVEDSIYINQMLKNLKDKERQIVILRCCNELTFKEIASVMKCPESTVKSRYKKALKILREKAGEL